MISTLKEVREALFEATSYTSSQAWSPSMTRDCEAAIAKLDALIAAHSQQEPARGQGAVAMFVSDNDCGHVDLLVHQGEELIDGQLLYAAPPSAAEPHVPETNFGNIEPLTEIDCEFSAMNPLCEESIFDLAGNYDCGMREENQQWQFTSQRQLLLFVRAVEAAHGIGAKP